MSTKKHDITNAELAKITDWYLCPTCRSNQLGTSVLAPTNYHPDGQPTVSWEELARVDPEGRAFFYCKACDKLFSTPHLFCAPGGLQ